MEFAEEKQKAYDGFVEMLFKIMQMYKPGQEQSEDFQNKTETMVIDLAKRLMLYGSPEVIYEYRKFRTPGLSGTETILQAGKVLNAMRKDLGIQDKDIDPATLMGIFITNANGADNN